MVKDGKTPFLTFIPHISRTDHPNIEIQKDLNSDHRIVQNRYLTQHTSLLTSPVQNA